MFRRRNVKIALLMCEISIVFSLSLLLFLVIDQICEQADRQAGQRRRGKEVIKRREVDRASGDCVRVGAGFIFHRSLLSAMSWTRTCSRTMARSSLARSSSISLVLPLAPQQQKSLLYTLRRAQSSIPAIECAAQTAADTSKLNIGSQQLVLPARDVDQDSYFSDCTSCNSSVADYFELVDEPQRVSKDILRSLSTSFRWLEVPFHEFDLPACGSDKVMNTLYEPESTTPYVEHAKPAVPKSVNKESVSHIYIHECRTGKNVLNHEELKTAMDSLQHWTMQVPRNCCLSYRHDISGEVATLSWPDLEAGGPGEIEDFVSMVNRMEGRPVFFPRYGRSPYYSMTSMSSIPLSPRPSPAMSAMFRTCSTRFSQESV